MRLNRTLIVLSLIAALCVCSFAQNEGRDTLPLTEIPKPMATFARMVGGEWKMTAQSGTSLYDSWHWGPGKHSLRMVTEGQAADGSPWRALQVVYWHPGREQVCVLSMHPDVPGIGRGVGDGTIRFDGDTLDAIFDLYQSRGPRKLRSRSIFAGHDKYHATLSESSGPGGYQPLTDWEYVRVNDSAPTGPELPEEALRLPEELSALQPFIGHTWDAEGNGESREDFRVQSTFAFVPLAEYISGCAVNVTASGVQTHILDVYFYHHVGIGALRCLALSHNGGVYEGDVTVLEGGALQIDLNGYEGKRTLPRVVRFDFDQDGSLRQRVWSLQGSERTLILDFTHKKHKS